MNIQEVIDSPELCEIARKAVEDALIELRDMRVSMLNRCNGLVIREYDGTESKVIRLGMEDAIRIGLEAILKHVNS